MSIVLDMLSQTESTERVNPAFFAAPDSVSVKHAECQMQLPAKAAYDYYDLKEYIRIANQNERVKALAIADSTLNEGSSTIATYLAFLMGGGLVKKLESPQAVKVDGVKVDFKNPQIEDSAIDADIKDMEKFTTVKADDFSNWEQDVDSRYVVQDYSQETLLIDANLHQPELHRYFGIDNDNGLSQVIMDNANWEEAMWAVKDSNLKVLPAGHTSMNPAEVLGSDRFRELVRLWKQQFKYVIFASPAVLNHTDSLSLASAVDGVVLVVRAGQTRWDNAQHAKRKLSAAQANLLGVTLNRQKSNIPDGLYKKLM